MIQELKIKNFLSFKDEVVLSFEATKDESLEDNYVVEVAQGVRLLRFAMVMGANASGKSNLLYALDFLRRWWFDRPDDVDIETGAVPFMLDSVSMNEPSELELRFWVNKLKYCYYLKLDQKQVYNEKLAVYRSVQPTMVFNRELVDGHTVITFNPAVEKISEVGKEEIQVKCLNNMSVFAARQKVNLNLSTFDEVRDWMQTGILPIISPKTSMFEWAAEEMTERQDVQEHIIQFLTSSDFNIRNITSKDSVTKIPEMLVNMMVANPGLPQEERDRIKAEKTLHEVDITFTHEVENERGTETYPMDSLVESYGTRRTIGMEAAIFEATKENSFINADEFDASMHHDLIIFVLKRFLMQNSHSQMLVTTHCTPLLGWIDKLIRRDSVWFTERGKDGGSNLFSLVEFKGLNRLSSIQRAYLDGKFGAVPNIEDVNPLNENAHADTK